MQHRHGWTFALAVIAVGAMAVATPAMAGKFRKIVDTNTPIPNGGGAMFAFSDNELPAIGGDWVAFGSAIGGGCCTFDQSIWRSTKAGARMVKLITPGTTMPGGWGTAGQIGVNGRVQIDGDTVLFFGTKGIFTISTSGRRLRKLVDRNDTSNVFPGSDKAFGDFSGDLRVRDGVVVFSNRAHVFSVPLGGGAVTPIAGSQSAGVSPPEPYCCLFSEPSIKNGKVFLRGGNGGFSSALASVGGGAPGFEFVATKNRPPRTPQGHRFNDTGFGEPVIDESFVFGGHSEGPNLPHQIRGIYSRGDNGFVRLVDDTMDVPLSDAGQKCGWGSGWGPIVAENGIVVYWCRRSDGTPGLYAVRQTGGRIKKIIHRGDSINGFAAHDFGVGRAALSANLLGGTTLVFRVWYAGGGSGMYSIDLSLP